MSSQASIERRAEQAVARMTDAQVCRVAELDPACIPLSVPSDLDASDTTVFRALQDAISRLCRQRCARKSA